MTVFVQGLQIIDAGETVLSDGRIGFELNGSATALPTRLVDLGDIQVRQTGDGVHAIGVLATSPLLGTAAAFEIGPSGSLEVSSDGADGRAYAVLANRLTNFTNAGSVKVAAASGDALAVVMGDFVDQSLTVHVVNDGSIKVVGAAYALGIDIDNGTVENNGRIVVHGALFNNYGVSLFDSGALVNTGLIAAHSVDKSGLATGVIIDIVEGGANSIVNSGEIRAAVAIEADNFTFDGALGLALDNSGMVRGDLELSAGADVVLNTGQIIGRIDLSAGDDVFDGRAGAGFDTVIGGGGADWMAAGHGDLFLFRFASEAAPSNPDLILNVDKSVVIDLSVIDAVVFESGDQGFRLVHAFTDTAGELVLVRDSSTGLTTVEGDTDGDGQADLAIQLEGKGAAHFDNFVL
jgi:hypothetical protein